MNISRILPSLAILTIGLAGCTNEAADPSAPVSGTPSQPDNQIQRVTFDLPLMFDCLREEGGAVIAAHRGGPYPGYPENAIETFQHGYDNGVRVFEIDIAESADGVLFLMHDRTLTRTTTGEGFVAEKNWADISKLRLVDNDGKTTAFSIPTLEEALNWATKTGAILELDKKPTTSFGNIIDAVKAAHAEDNVIIITYDDDQAGEVARIAPDLMMTATAYGDRNIKKLENLGVKRENLIAWTGTDTIKPAAWKRVSDEGVEAAFGTLGRSGERLDDQYLADGNGSEYQELIKKGLVLLATDSPLEAAEFTDGDDIARDKCGL